MIPRCWTDRRLPRTLATLGLLALAVPAALAQEGAPSGAAKGRELLAAGRYEAALPFFQRDLAEAEAGLGPDNPSLAVPLNDLAEANRLAGRPDRAEALYLRALELDERAGSKDAQGLATTLNNLALLYRAEGRPAEAEKLHLRSLNLLEDALGPSAAPVALSLHNLAALYRQQGRLDQARALQERAVAVADKSLGPRHPDTRKLRTTLAALGDAPAAAPPPARRERRPPPPAAAGKGALPPPPVEGQQREGPVAVGAGGGGFAVQVAAVPERDQVPGEWRRLAKRHPALQVLELQPTQAVEVAGKGTFYRVIAGPLRSKADAEALCARLRQAGASCRLART